MALAVESKSAPSSSYVDEDTGVVGALARLNIQLESSHHPKLPGARWIRLLRIIEGDSELLSVTVEPFSLEALPPYEALSYTWEKALITDLDEDNESETTHEILMNGHLISATKNLYDGLYVMRNDVKGYLWIDALCINQADNDERGSQVLLMGDIYPYAERVIIWLGNTVTDDLLNVIWLEENWLPVVDRFPAKELPRELLEFLCITKEKWFALWESYGNFYSTYRWFSRAWVVQELLLAREVILRCVNKILHWEALKLLATSSVEARVPNGSRKPGEFTRLLATREFIVNGDYLEALWAFNTGSKTTEQRWYAWLMHLIDTIRSQNATCLHDKIYAVFGIARKSLPPIPNDENVLKSITVNYEQPIEEAYSYFAAELLRNLPELAFLSHVLPMDTGSDTPIQGLPSWCPNFTTKSRYVPLVIMNTHLENDYLINFTASGSLNREDGPCEVNGRVLSVSGKRVARVEHRGQETEAVFDPESPFVQPGAEGFFDSCRQLDPVYDLTGEDRVEVLWRTLIINNDSATGLNDGGFPDAQIHSEAFSSFIMMQSSYAMRALEGIEAAKLVLVIAQRTVDFWTSDIQLCNASAVFEIAKMLQDDPFSPELEEWKSFSSFFWYRAGQHSGRRLFTTTQKWLGLGPVHPQKNDEVWLLKNARVPFILRPHGESQYSLIGEAYVHGIMQGELVDAPGGSEGFQEIEII